MGYPDDLVVISLGDFHSGSDVGLLPPDMTLVKIGPRGELVEFEPEQNLTQEMIWGLFERQLHDAVRLADDRQIYLLIGGDVCQGTKYTEQCFEGGAIARNQVSIARTCVKKAAQITKCFGIWIVIGTQSHNEAGGLEAQVTFDLRERVECPVVSAYHPLIDCGVQIDAAHHGPTKGLRGWLHGNMPRYYLRDRMWKEIERDRRPPHIFDRHHFHVYRREELDALWRGKSITSTIVLVPSYCGMTGHGEQATKSEPYLETGLVAYEVSGERVGVTPIVHETDLRTRL